MACGRPAKDAAVEWRGDDESEEASEDVTVGAMENEADCDSGSAVKGGVRGDDSGSAFVFRGLDDGKVSEEVMVGAKLRCCRKSSK